MYWDEIVYGGDGIEYCLLYAYVGNVWHIRSCQNFLFIVSMPRKCITASEFCLNQHLFFPLGKRGAELGFIMSSLLSEATCYEMRSGV
jgi:hypothetical protein